MSNFPLREMNLTRLHLLSVLPDFFFFLRIKMRQKYLLHCSGYSFTFISLLYICHSEPLQMARSPVHYILLLFSCFTVARHPVHYIHHLLSHFRVPVSCTVYPPFTLTLSRGQVTLISFSRPTFSPTFSCFSLFPGVPTTPPRGL